MANVITDEIISLRRGAECRRQRRRGKGRRACASLVVRKVVRIKNNHYEVAACVYSLTRKITFANLSG